MALRCWLCGRDGFYRAAICGYGVMADYNGDNATSGIIALRATSRNQKAREFDFDALLREAERRERAEQEAIMREIAREESEALIRQTESRDQK